MGEQGWVAFHRSHMHCGCFVCRQSDKLTRIAVSALLKCAKNWGCGWGYHVPQAASVSVSSLAKWVLLRQNCFHSLRELHLTWCGEGMLLCPPPHPHPPLACSLVPKTVSGAFLRVTQITLSRLAPTTVCVLEWRDLSLNFHLAQKVTGWSLRPVTLFQANAASQGVRGRHGDYLAHLEILGRLVG